MEKKKLALLRIVQILESYSDRDHPLSQEDIAKRLLNDYDIVLERKAVSANLSLLMEAGYDIEHLHGQGYYLCSRDFDNSEYYG